MITALPSDQPVQGPILPAPQPCIIIGGREVEGGSEIFVITCGPFDPIGPHNNQVPMTYRPYSQD